MTEQSKKHEILISLLVFGSDAIEIFKGLLRDCRSELEILDISSVYRLRAVQAEARSNHDLYGARWQEGLCLAIKAKTDMAHLELKKWLEELGRKGPSRPGGQGALIALLAFDQEAYLHPQLTLPHPELHQRAEFLIPAAEAWPQFNHPILKQSLFEISKSLSLGHWGEFHSPGKSLLDF